MPVQQEFCSSKFVLSDPRTSQNNGSRKSLSTMLCFSFRNSGITLARFDLGAPSPQMTLRHH
jgi:hypothetical protein